MTAVDAHSGALTVFTKESGVDLADAVAASCAVPGVWPPVTIGGHRYVDGGVRLGSNADLAVGCERVLVITPSRADAPQPWGNLDDEIVDWDRRSPTSSPPMWRRSPRSAPTRSLRPSEGPPPSPGGPWAGPPQPTSPPSGADCRAGTRHRQSDILTRWIRQLSFEPSGVGRD